MLGIPVINSASSAWNYFILWKMKYVMPLDAPPLRSEVNSKIEVSFQEEPFLPHIKALHQFKFLIVRHKMIECFDKQHLYVWDSIVTATQ